MGGSRNIQAPKPQASEYTPVYQKDGNYYKRDAPTQANKGKAMGGVAQHGGNPIKASKNKGKASQPSYTQIGGGMSQTADMPLKANRFQIGNYQPQAGAQAQTQTGFVNDKRGLTGRGGQPNGILRDPYASNKMAPYRGGVGSMIGKGMF